MTRSGCTIWSRPSQSSSRPDTQRVEPIGSAFSTQLALLRKNTSVTSPVSSSMTALNGALTVVGGEMLADPAFERDDLVARGLADPGPRRSVDDRRSAGGARGRGPGPGGSPNRAAVEDGRDLRADAAQLGGVDKQRVEVGGTHLPGLWDTGPKIETGRRDGASRCLRGRPGSAVSGSGTAIYGADCADPVCTVVAAAVRRLVPPALPPIYPGVAQRARRVGADRGDERRRRGRGAPPQDQLPGLAPGHA